MPTKNLNDIIQIIGLFALIASLIFVSMRMKQAEDIAIAAQYQERAAMAMDYWISREQSEFTLRRMGEREIARHGLPPGADENERPEEIASRIIGLEKTFVIFDNHHFQYSSGFLTEESWSRYRKSLQLALSAPISKHFIEYHATDFRSSFRDLCERLMADNDS